jgi:hypothetical protein
MLRSCKWLSPGPATTRGRIKVVARDVAGHLARSISSEDFTVSKGAPFVSVTNPGNGVSWATGTIRQITWADNLGLAAPVRIDQSLDGGATWSVIADRVNSATAATGGFDWRVPKTPTMAALVRVVSLKGLATGVGSVFTIRPPTIDLSLRAGDWNIGKPGLIRWTHNLPVGTLMTIEITRDGGLSWVSIAQVRARGTDERYSWAPPGRPTGTAKIRVSAPACETSATSQAFAIR